MLQASSKSQPPATGLSENLLVLDEEHQGKDRLDLVDLFLQQRHISAVEGAFA